MILDMSNVTTCMVRKYTWVEQDKRAVDDGRGAGRGSRRPVLDGAMTLAILLLWFQLAYSIRIVVDAFHASPTTWASSSRSIVASLRLHGVSELRAKFSSSSSSSTQ